MNSCTQKCLAPLQRTSPLQRQLYPQHAYNNPVKYIDPSGHRGIIYDRSIRETDGGGGANFVDPYTGRDVRDILDALNNAIDRAIPSGIGISCSISPELATAPLVNAEGGLYVEIVYLWRNGSLVAVTGNERQANIGLPSAGGEISVGFMTYHNIDEPVDLLGKDYFGEVEIGEEVIGTASLSKSVSFSVDETNEKLVRNPRNNGFMYSTETALNLGLDIISTGGDFQVGGGSSQTNELYYLIQ